MDDEKPWWREGAVCAEIGPDLFFVGKGQSVQEAKRACAKCPVRLQCLADSIDTTVEYGIFGGFAPAHRQMLSLQVGTTHDSTEVAERAIYKETHGRRRVDWNR